jgi:hypothetical protein
MTQASRKSRAKNRRLQMVSYRPGRVRGRCDSPALPFLGRLKAEGIHLRTSAQPPITNAVPADGGKASRRRDSRSVAQAVGAHGCAVGRLRRARLGENYKVTNTRDSGAGALRRAIERANAHRGYDAVVFGLRGSGPHTIAPASPLPPITDGLKIQGYSQVGARENTRAVGSDAMIEVELSGWRARRGADGLVVRAGGSYVTGLAVNGFDGDGIEINSRSNKIVGNHIGTDPAGELDRNGLAGVRVRGGALNQIGEGTSHHNRNVISGNRSGVVVSGSGSLDNRLLNS